MSKRRPGTDGGMVQLRLPLSALPTAGLQAGGLRCKDAVREALTLALERSGLDREYVVGELSRLVGETVSRATLDSWTAESKGERRLPLEYAGALAVLLGDTSLVQAALDACGLRVLGAQDVAVYEIGRITVEKRKRSQRERQLWEQVNGT